MSSGNKRKRVTFATDNEEIETYENIFYKDLDDAFEKKITVDTESISDRLYQLICLIEENTDTYLNHEAIIEDFKISLSKHQEGMINRCTQCGEDMGRSNPRQLCGKTYCCNEEF